MKKMTNKLNNEQEVKLILSVIVDNYCNEFNDDYGECWEAVELQFINELYKIIAAEMNKVREETKKDIEDVIHHEIMEISDRVLSVGVSKPDANQVGMILFTDLGVKLIRKLHALQDKEKYD